MQTLGNGLSWIADTKGFKGRKSDTRPPARPARNACAETPCVVSVVVLVACIGSILYRVCVEVVLYFRLNSENLTDQKKVVGPAPRPFSCGLTAFFCHGTKQIFKHQMLAGN